MPQNAQSSSTDIAEPSIRFAESRDLPSVVEMIGRLAAYHGDAASTDAAVLARDAFGERRWIDILLAQIGDEAVGYAMLCPLYKGELGERGLDLHHLFVASEHRGQRIGRALVDAAAAHARDLGCSYLRVGTHPFNAKAQRTYVRFGFEPTPAAGPRFQLRLVP